MTGNTVGVWDAVSQPGVSDGVGAVAHRAPEAPADAEGVGFWLGAAPAQAATIRTTANDAMTDRGWDMPESVPASAGTRRRSDRMAVS